jgi:DNA-binding NarL/FixJ family response regulator
MMIQSKSKSELVTGSHVFVIVTRVNQPVALAAVCGELDAKELSDLATSMFGNCKADLTFFDVSVNEPLINEKMKQFLALALPYASKSEKNDGQGYQKCKPVFTNRELEILQLIATEYTNEQIADKLCLAKRTVDNHRVNLMQRANAKNTAGLIGFAFRNGLVK